MSRRVHAIDETAARHPTHWLICAQVVTKDVPPGMTVVGLNKLLDPHIDAKREKVVKKRTETWQYEVDTYDGYSI